MPATQKGVSKALLKLGHTLELGGILECLIMYFSIQYGRHEI